MQLNDELFVKKDATKHEKDVTVLHCHRIMPNQENVLTREKITACSVVVTSLLSPEG